MDWDECADVYAYGLSAAEVLSVCDVPGLGAIAARCCERNTRLNDTVIPTHNDMVIANTTMGK